MPVRFSCITWLRKSTVSCILVKRGCAILTNAVIRIRVMGRRTTMIKESLGFVTHMRIMAPMNVSGILVNMRRLMVIISLTWFRSLVRRVNNCPVVNSSRFPKLKVCIFSNMASLRSASKPLDALIAMIVFPIIKMALNILAPTMRRLVFTIMSISFLTTPSSMIT